MTIEKLLLGFTLSFSIDIPEKELIASVLRLLLGLRIYWNGRDELVKDTIIIIYTI